MFYTYAHTKPDGTIFYIGAGSGRRAWSKTSRTQYWTNIEKKYGRQVEILANWKTSEEAFDHEKLLISCFRDMGYKLANFKDGGDGGGKGNKHTDQVKEALRQLSLSNGSVERCVWMANDPEIKAKRIAATTGKKRNNVSKQNMRNAKKDVMRSFTVCGKTFESITEFSRVTNSFSTTIRRWLNEGRFDKLEERYNAKIS